MDESILRDLAHSAGVESLLISRFSDRRTILLADTQPSAHPDVFPGVLSLLFAAGEKHLFVERWDAINHIVEPEWTQLSKWDEAKLSVETLLDMTGGIDHAFAKVGDIGHSFRFEPSILSKLTEVLETQTGRPLTHLVSDWLTRPLGLPETDCSVEPVDSHPSYQLSISAESIHQLGIAMLKGELFDGSYLMAMREPAASTQKHFRLLWWNHLPALLEALGQTPVPTSAPKDLLIATENGQVCLAVSGAHDLVVTAVGHPRETNRASALELLATPEFWTTLEPEDPKTSSGE